MSNFTLPTSGQVSWGNNLNNYIRNLEQRLNGIETQLIRSTDYSKYYGNAGSGLMTVAGYSCIINDGVIKVAGKFFFGGDINRVYDIDLDKSINKEIDFSFNGYKFICLRYNGEVLEISVDNNLDNIDYSIIPVGIVYKNDSNNNIIIPLYFMSNKSLINHYNDMFINRKVMTNSSFKLNYKIDENKDMLISWAGDNCIKYYCDSLATNDVGSQVILSPLKPYDNITNNMSTIVIEDSLKSSNEKTFSYIGNIIPVSDYIGIKVGRILMTVSGQLIIQLYKEEFNNISYEDLYSQSFSSLLYTLPFNQDLTQSDNSSTIIYNLTASLFVEIGRFAISHSKTISAETTETNELIAFNIINNDFPIIFYNALGNGLSPQQSFNMWTPTPNKVPTKDVIFYTNSDSDNNSFKFNCEQHSESSPKILTIDANSSGCLLMTQNTLEENVVIDTGVNDISLQSKNLLLTSDETNINSDDIKLKTFNDENEEFNSISINKDGINIDSNNLSIVSKNTILNGKENLFIVSKNAITVASDIQMGNNQILFSSDKRIKENIKDLSTNFLDVVNSTKIKSFNFKDDKQLKIGLIAQELKENLKENASSFITISEKDNIKDFHSINETKLSYILWKALQEECGKRKELEKRIEELEHRL